MKNRSESAACLYLCDCDLIKGVNTETWAQHLQLGQPEVEGVAPRVGEVDLNGLQISQ